MIQKAGGLVPSPGGGFAWVGFGKGSASFGEGLPPGVGSGTPELLFCGSLGEGNGGAVLVLAGGGAVFSFA